ncbi:MAG: hypothetical protein KAJ40_07405 [Alphaproteobacteria bacterium]|nr:hypothetical protein [Alphaproteobacteria bacterium]
MAENLRKKRAWVVFTDQSELKFVRYLKHGFRHCFVLIHDGKHWMSVDPMANYMEVITHELSDDFADFDFAHWLKEQGYCVIEAQLKRNIMHCAPVMLFTCVEACKRILGIHKFSILTPWQLYQYLDNRAATYNQKEY